jgi:hypothetical protein
MHDHDIALASRCKDSAAENPPPKTIEEAARRYSEAWDDLNQILLEYHGIVPLWEKNPPSRDEVARAEEEYQQTEREFLALGGREALRCRQEEPEPAVEEEATTIEEAYERFRIAVAVFDWTQAEYRSDTLPPAERPDIDELDPAERKYIQAERKFEAMGGYEALHRVPDQHEDMYGSGYEDYEL